MILPRFSVWMFSFGIMFLGAGFVSGQNYPTKPVRIVTSGIGGGNDFVSRLIAQGVSGPLGQQVIVDNRPSGVIPGDIVAKAPPDGYTVLIASGSLWILTLLQDNVPYDPVRDFAPISSIDRDSNVLVVIPSLPAKSVKELIALAKARPGELNYASTATGASGHLSAELFKAMAGVNIVRIPYKGNAQAFTDLIGSQAQVQLMFPSAGSVATHVKSDRLRALAVTAAQPSALFPGLPTVAAAGLPGYEFASISGMFAPAKTPEAIVKRLNQEVVRVLNLAEMKEKFLNSGVESNPSSPEELAGKIKGEMSKMGKVIRDAGIRAD